jgi:transposase InsO family protein
VTQYLTPRRLERLANAERRRTRQWYLDHALEDVRRHGYLRKSMRAWLGTQLGIDERQVRRLIASGGYKQHERQQISEEIRETLWDLRGDVAKTARRLGIARSTLSDAVQLYVPATERAEMRSGEKAHREAELYLPQEHEFGDPWQSDVKFVSIEVEDPITGVLVQPRVIHTKCPCTRVVVGWYALLRNFQGADIIEGTKRAMEIRHEDGPFGGTPRRWQLDNAPEHHGKPFVAYLETLGVQAIWTKDHSPDANGSVEAFNKWAEYDYAASHERYLHRPQTRNNKPRPVAAQPMTWSDFVAEYGDFVYYYNHRRVHSTLGRTPADEWARLVALDAEDESA